MHTQTHTLTNTQTGMHTHIYIYTHTHTVKGTKLRTHTNAHSKYTLPHVMESHIYLFSTFKNNICYPVEVTQLTVKINNNIRISDLND